MSTPSVSAEAVPSIWVTGCAVVRQAVAPAALNWNWTAGTVPAGKGRVPAGFTVARSALPPPLGPEALFSVIESAAA